MAESLNIVAGRIDAGYPTAKKEIRKKVDNWRIFRV